ncbi:MAG: hypothetical protein QGG42_18985 [Phycisphaerae bacterium]|jgi:hypothetical protein|nr:hypothetical protein [Phycisphaerae bacterium]
MSKKPADAETVRILRELAAHPENVTTTATAKYDLMGLNLTNADICDALREWIDESKEVKQTVMRGKDAGRPAYEIKPHLGSTLLYCKFIVRDIGDRDKRLCIISAHVDH